MFRRNHVGCVILKYPESPRLENKPHHSQMSTPQPLLATANMAKSYGPVVALRSVDMSVRRGEIHALLGANGAGKSTLVKILAGVQSADAGVMTVDGKAMRFK